MMRAFTFLIFAGVSLPANAWWWEVAGFVADTPPYGSAYEACITGHRDTIEGQGLVYDGNRCAALNGSESGCNTGTPGGGGCNFNNTKNVELHCDSDGSSRIWVNTMDPAVICSNDIPTCSPPSVYDPISNLCVIADCDKPAGSYISQGPYNDGDFIPNEVCFQDCQFLGDYFELLDPEGTVANAWYKSTGAVCTADDGGDQPIPDDTGGDGSQTAPEDPAPPIPDDGNETDEQATDENQEHMSEQMSSMEGELNQHTEILRQIAGNTDTVENILERIANNTENGFGGGVGGEEEESVTGGQDCATPPVCSGDVIDCATLIQQWETRCLYVELTEPVDTSGADYQKPDDTVYNIDTEITGMLNPSGFLAGSCPAPKAINISLGSYELDYTPLCTLAESIAPLVLVVSSLLGFRNVYNGII